MAMGVDAFAVLLQLTHTHTRTAVCCVLCAGLHSGDAAGCTTFC
jgi:hypothetical protein